MRRKITDQKLIEEYLDVCRRRGLSTTTIRMRKAYLNKVSKEIGILDATRDSIAAWLDRPSLQDQSRATLRTTLHGFYAWAVEEELMVRNPVLKVPKFKAHKGQPHPIPQGELTLAIEKADPDMKCWLLLGSRMAMRVGEISQVRREDIDFEANTLHIIHGKGGKERQIPLTSDVRQAMESITLPVSGALWPSQTPQRLSKATNAYLHGLGIKSVFHATRHRALTDIYRASHDIILTQRIAGHSSPAVTGIYADADMSKAAGIMESIKIGA